MLLITATTTIIVFCIMFKCFLDSQTSVTVNEVIKQCNVIRVSLQVLIGKSHMDWTLLSTFWHFILLLTLIYYLARVTRRFYLRYAFHHVADSTTHVHEYYCLQPMERETSFADICKWRFVVV